MFKYNSNIEISKVGLKVKNLKVILEYYEKLGFDILEENKKTAKVGILKEDKVLLELVEIENLKINRETVGLYHVAYLLPSSKDLGDFLNHISKEKIKIVGMAHHGYSDAIYLEDPEGNGIEIYCDVPFENWDIRENGEIVGITTIMDTKKFLSISDDLENFKFPLGTKIGHLHLTIKEGEKIEELFEEFLDMTLKCEIHKAKFYSSGQYHHHFAVNSWNTRYFSYPSEKDNGLLYYELFMEERAFKDLLKNLKNRGYLFKDIEGKKIYLSDFNGVEVRIESI